MTGADSCSVCVNVIIISLFFFFSGTACKVKSVCAGNETVLKLVRCEVLQTEVRVLYELLHVLHNSFRANKTLQALRQVRTHCA